MDPQLSFWFKDSGEKCAIAPQVHGLCTAFISAPTRGRAGIPPTKVPTQGLDPMTTARMQRAGLGSPQRQGRRNRIDTLPRANTALASNHTALAHYTVR